MKSKSKTKKSGLDGLQVMMNDNSVYMVIGDSLKLIKRLSQQERENILSEAAKKQSN